MKTLYINGKYTAQSVTGVQRVALELVRALDQLRASVPMADRRRCVLLCPAWATLPTLQTIEVRAVAGTALASGSLQAWEQLALPRAASDGLLLNLSGSAPLRGSRRAYCLIHDAAVFDQPQAYTLTFKLWYRLLFGHLARTAAGLLTVSAFSRQRLEARLATPAGAFHVVRNGADHILRTAQEDQVLAHLGVQTGRFLLVVGTAKQTKNVAAVLAAWRDMPDRQGHQLVWVGGENTRVFAGAEALHLHAERDRAAGILHAGFIDDAKLKSLYAHAAGMVIASHYEGFGLPAIEAMACGCPVAAAHAASLPEVCGEAATYFDPCDGSAIAEAMRQLLFDDARRERLRGLGLARSQGYRWDLAARDLWAWLEAKPGFRADQR